MAFFDELGKKLSQAGQNAVQKTKEVADIARINGAISDEEKKINNTYFQIGKLYVSLHEKDFDEDFGGMVSAVLESEAKIRDYRQQIQDIKGVIRCENCGAEVANNSAFCSSCGAAMPKPASAPADADTVTCAGCGASVPKGMKFCTSCGARVEAAPAADPKCPTCGADIQPGVAFCTECGTKIN